MSIIRLSMPIDRPEIEAAAGDTPRRTIAGVAVPWEVPAVASTGPVMFLRGSLPTDGPAPKLIRDHDPTNPIGIVTERIDTPDGMRFSARISDTSAGSEALTLAADGVLDSVSVGVDPIEAEMIDGVLVVAAGRWLELSLLPFGAFASAKLDLVAASAGTEENEPTAEPEHEPTEPTEPEPTEGVPTMPTDDAIVPNPSLRLGAAPARVTAAEYIAATISGQMTPAIRAVAAEEVVSDIPGLVPDLLTGTIWDALGADRPIISALGTLAMPGGGESFYRRRVVDHTTIDEQGPEFTELASSVYTVERLQVDKVWLGGYLDVSEQAAAYADAALLDLIISDMARMYARKTEQYVAQFIGSNAVTPTTTISDYTDGDQVIEALYKGAAYMKAVSYVMPTHLLVSGATWAQLGTAVDGSGNRIFPYLGPSNASGTFAGAAAMNGNPLGLTMVVSNDLPTIANNAAFLVHSRVLEVYEDRRGALRVEQPATLSTRLAFRGIIAAANLDNGGTLNLTTPV